MTWSDSLWSSRCTRRDHTFRHPQGASCRLHSCGSCSSPMGRRQCTGRHSRTSRRRLLPWGQSCWQMSQCSRSLRPHRRSTSSYLYPQPLLRCSQPSKTRMAWRGWNQSPWTQEGTDCRPDSHLPGLSLPSQQCENLQDKACRLFPAQSPPLVLQCTPDFQHHNPSCPVSDSARQYRTDRQDKPGTRSMLRAKSH